MEIVEEKGAEVKVHYVGYGSEYDEWKPRTEIVHTKPDFGSDCNERKYSTLTELACCIKKTLQPSQGDDPDAVSRCPSMLQLSRCSKTGIPWARHECDSSDVYTVAQYSDLNDILGDNWHFLIVKRFSYASYLGKYCIPLLH